MQAFATPTCLCLTTVAHHDEATRLAEALIAERLAACVNIVGPIQSVYRWQGEVQHDEEWQLQIKTASSHLPKLEARLLALHPYTVPAFIVLPVTHLNTGYASWLGAELTPAAPV